MPIPIVGACGIRFHPTRGYPCDPELMQRVEEDLAHRLPTANLPLAEALYGTARGTSRHSWPSGITEDQRTTSPPFGVNPDDAIPPKNHQGPGVLKAFAPQGPIHIPTNVDNCW